MYIKWPCLKKQKAMKYMIEVYLYICVDGERCKSKKQWTHWLLYGWKWYELGGDLTLSLFYLTSYYEKYINIILLNSKKKKKISQITK